MFVQNLNGDIACDLRFGKCMEVYLSKKGDTARDLGFWEVYLSKSLRGTLLAISDLGSSFVKSLRGTLLAIEDFGKCICPKPEGGHCLRFEIWEV